jgi:Transketolase, N-terminal subunit
MEIMAVLCGEVLRVDPKEPLKTERDRLLISKNHCTIAHFPALVEKGFIKEEELESYAVDGSRLIGYPYRPEIGIEYSGGSLGMAISVGVGQALAAKKKNKDYNVYVLMGDGELNEGSIWEAFMSAKQFGLGNLTVVIDRNHLCYDGTTEEVMQLGDLTAKMESFGFNTINCCGHDISDLLRAFAGLSDEIPNAVICDTVKGKGLSFAENRPEWHQKALTKEQYDIALADLMGGKVI